MAVEAATYINQLDATKPDGASPKSEGDDNIRLLKSTITATFPNITGPVNATQAQINMLVGKASVASLQDIANAQLAASVPGVNDPANADRFFKGGGVWSSVDLRGSPAIDKGNSGTTAQVIDYTQGEGQTITATGAHSLSVANFPANRMAGVLLRMNGYGNFALTTTGITWIKGDGTLTTNFATSGIVLSTGTSFVALYSYGDGTVYAKVAR